uniref:Uncharacterized protein n=1 Tax=Ditylenchus dipsaci TaxID=166011 RepID=A0A915CS38_9BILA
MILLKCGMPAADLFFMTSEVNLENYYFDSGECREFAEWMIRRGAAFFGSTHRLDLLGDNLNDNSCQLKHNIVILLTNIVDLIPQNQKGVITDQVFASHASLNDLQPVLLSNMKVPMVHTGCYLLCRTIEPAYCTFGTMTLIEDLTGDIEKLFLCNFRLDINDSKWLPRGTIMLIKEPWLRYDMIGEDVMIQVDSPSDVVFLDKTDRKIMEFYNALKWYGPQTLTQEQLQLEGNKCSKKPDLPVIHLNKAQTLIRLNRFFEAYKEAKVGLDGGGNQEKALFRMGKASYGMRSWQQALVHFETLQSLFPQSEEAKSFIERTHSRLKETSTGTFDLHELYRQAVYNKCRDLDIADYVGPIEVAEIAGEGRGVIASKDIVKGTLLLVSKAFFIAYEDMLDTSLFAINTISDNLDEKTAVLNKIGVMQKLQHNHRCPAIFMIYLLAMILAIKNLRRCGRCKANTEDLHI